MTKANVRNPFYNQIPSADDVQRWQTQAAKIFEAFHQQPRTMRQVSRITGIERANVCRRVDDFRKQGLIQVTKVDTDPESNFKAQYFSTNKLFWPNELGIQINIFQ